MQFAGKHPLKQQAHPRSLPNLGAIQSEHPGQDASRKRLAGAPLAVLKGQRASLPSLVPNGPRVHLPLLKSLRENERNVARSSKPVTPDMPRFAITSTSFRSTSIGFPAGRLPALQEGTPELPLPAGHIPFGRTNASFFSKASRASTPGAYSSTNGWGDRGHLCRLKAAEEKRIEGLRLKQALTHQTRGVNLVSSVTSKRNQAAALAADRGFVLSSLVREETDSRLQRARAFNEHWLATLFAPVPEPKKLLSAQIASRLPPAPMDDMQPQEEVEMHMCVAFQGQASLATGRPEFVLPSDPATPSSPSSSKKQATGQLALDDDESEEFEMELEELQQLIKVIQDMNSLSTLNTRQNSKTAGPAIMTRAAFCRLVCALDGLYSEHRPRLRRAVAHFDAHTESFMTDDEYGMKREVLGIRVSPPTERRGKDRDPFEELEELPITKLFKILLQEMYDDACNAGTRRRTAKQNLKTQIFKEALPRASEYCKRRSAHLEAQISAAVAAAVLENSRGKPPTPPPEQKMDWSDPIPQKDFSDQLANMLGYPPNGSEGIKTNNGEEISVEELMGLKDQKLKNAFPIRVWMEVKNMDWSEPIVQEDFSNQLANMLGYPPKGTERIKTNDGKEISVKELMGLKNRNLKMAFPVRVWKEVDEVAPENEDNEQVEACELEQPNGTANYADTFVVLKGETLMCKLFEPEVMGFIFEVSDVLNRIFQAYSDMPTPDGRGHMSLAAFLRFCGDFNWFPDLVDYKTIQWLYSSADTVVEEPVSEPESPASDETPTAAGKGKKRKSRKRVSSAQKEDEDPLASFTLISGKWVKSHLTWITKDPACMSESESRSINLLKAMLAWMRNRSLTTSEFFQFVVANGTGGGLSMEGLRLALELMSFDNPPTEEDVRELVLLLLPPATRGDCSPRSAKVLPDIELVALHGALTTVGLLNDTTPRALDVFLKDISKLTKEESNTVIFFRETLHTMDLTNKTPEMLFDLFDSDNTGNITEQHMTIQTHALMRMVGVATSALSVNTPFAPLNYKGSISKVEFCDLLAQVRESEKVRATEKQAHPVFLSSAAPEASSPQRGKHIFGPTAFVETLAKISLEHITERGNPTQSKLSSFHKLVWMFVFLHSSFESGKSKAAAKATLAGVDAVVSDCQGLGVDAEMSDRPKSLPPLQWLSSRYPNLFNEALRVPPELPPWATLQDRGDVLLDVCIGRNKLPADSSECDSPKIRVERLPDFVPFDRQLLKVMTGER
eukprot:TRINITY_DN2669_c0_g1_i1.p1 TRINITY_DN2669_c0_g1~~TRINITY_DN2669_c0_g1_i1.p1  ORF type:complete len:1243 (-),score=211.05 TRINITY_DN2669_c0_g1_i1:213-3941(-)